MSPPACTMRSDRREHLALHRVDREALLVVGPLVVVELCELGGAAQPDDEAGPGEQRMAGARGLERHEALRLVVGRLEQVRPVPVAVRAPRSRRARRPSRRAPGRRSLRGHGRRRSANTRRTPGAGSGEPRARARARHQRHLVLRAEQARERGHGHADAAPEREVLMGTRGRCVRSRHATRARNCVSAWRRTSAFRSVCGRMPVSATNLPVSASVIGALPPRRERAPLSRSRRRSCTRPRASRPACATCRSRC